MRPRRRVHANNPRRWGTALEAAGIRSLNEGDRVSFVPEDDRKGRGKQAGQLKKL
jgi:cold shock CspA family protein